MHRRKCRKVGWCVVWAFVEKRRRIRNDIILEWTTRLDTSSRTLFVRDSLTEGGGCPRHVERRVT